MKKFELIEKKVSLPQEVWDELSESGYKIPSGRFSMKHVMQCMNFNQLLKVLDKPAKFNLLLRILNHSGFKIHGTTAGIFFEICDNKKIEELNNFLIQYLQPEDKECQQEIIKFFEEEEKKHRGIMLTSNPKN